MQLQGVAFTTTMLRMGILGVAFCANVLISRQLNPSGRGEYQLALTIALLTATVVALSGEQGATELYAQDPGHRTQVVATALYLAPVLGLAVGVVAAVVTAMGAFGLSGDLWWVVGMIACVTVFQVWGQRLLLMDNKPVAAGVIGLLEASVFLAGSLILVGLNGMTVSAALAAYAGGLFVSSAVTVVIFRPSPQAARLQLAGRILQASARYHPGQILLYLLMRCDVLLLGSLASSSEVGSYAVAIAITGPLMVAGNTITTTFLQRQLTSDVGVGAQETVGLVRLTAVVIAPCSLAAAISAPFVIPLIWGQQFSGAILPTLALLPGVFFLAVQRPFGYFFVSGGRADITNQRAAVGAVTNVTFSIALVPTYGATGAGVAASVAYLVYSAESVRAFCRLSMVSTREVARSFIGVGGRVLR
ncbi:lipopolysaccharide biosynthesis protein [Nocardioides sp.]|uniref:lipopolysaccharide biosynthesis protein n=1 Tax=Nocardioides sp. TaxID=35761 RepID=UPI003782F18D